MREDDLLKVVRVMDTWIGRWHCHELYPANAEF